MTIYLIRELDDHDDWPGVILDGYFTSEEEAQKEVDRLMATVVSEQKERHLREFNEHHAKWVTDQETVKVLTEAGLPLPAFMSLTNPRKEPVLTDFTFNSRWSTQYEIEEFEPFKVDNS